MNIIRKSPVEALGYNFIEQPYLPKGKNEYYLRDIQNRSGIEYRGLTAYEIEVLVRNRNTSDDWNKILVSDAFTPELVQNCKFFGLVRIGKLEPFYLEFHNLRRPVGLYNSTIISCDLGDNVVVDNVNYISHYIVGNEVILVNVNEIAATDHSKFGNGILKEGEPEKNRIWLELCNENGGRRIIPFEGMLPGDAYLWTRHRDNTAFQHQLKTFTDKKFDHRRGYYGTIGDRTVVKNCKILKDVTIGSDAYLKGANKIKNVSINSSPQHSTQIGEGCELVNGIIEQGCRIFYGVKAVRFFMASHSQLKYGARLINSYLGNNSTISCCEVLNSLIFPAHEQHHNNSFLCAALLAGQSNMAAGATVGSNHNSRSADGEIIAGRGFWPGLCVSLKHNSRFASYAILAKGDYPVELNIQTPFSLVSNDVHNDRLLVMPGYWFLYNMYGLARNARKYIDRDKRVEKIQHIEYDYLAPDTINEMINSLQLIEYTVGKALLSKEGKKLPSDTLLTSSHGKEALLKNDETIDSLDITIDGFENSKREVRLLKARQCWQVFRSMIKLYAAQQIIQKCGSDLNIRKLRSSLPAKTKRTEWINFGGQLIEKAAYEKLITQISKGAIKGWDQIHQFYSKHSENYPSAKFDHAIASYKDVFGIDLKTKPRSIEKLIEESINIRESITENIHLSRKKDHTNPYRKMVYGSDKEMDTVVGSLKDNTFLLQEKKDLAAYKRATGKLLRK